MRKLFAIFSATALGLVLACAQTTEPEFGPQGSVTLHFASAPTVAAPPSHDATITMAAPSIDSVVVRVFRPGQPITQETYKGAKVGGADVDISLDCIAESGKRVSVDLFDVDGNFTHHGYTTGVSVAVGKKTAVGIDAYRFGVGPLVVTPGVAVDPEAFDLSWGSAPAATRYQVQSSSSADFASIEWQASFTDTVATASLTPGSHYFRVIPRTDFASGTPGRFEFGYVATGSKSLNITGFAAPAAIPGDVMTVTGENLDYPGTSFFIGSRAMTVMSVTWGSADLVVPRAASTERISATSALGTDTSDDALIVQRVAYVNSTGKWSSQYVEVLAGLWADFGYSGVAPIPISQLDTRDMGVFDVIIVGDDTGTNASNWGGGVAARATAITATTANVLALGDGGLAFLERAGTVSATSYLTNQTSYYTDTPSNTIYTTPHSVTGGNGGQWVDISQNNSQTVSIGVASPPSGTSLDACTALDCLLIICSPNGRWSLVEFQVPDAFSLKKRYVFWGYRGNPNSFTSQGEDLLGNAMHLLYNDRVQPAEPTD